MRGGKQKFHIIRVHWGTLDAVHLSSSSSHYNNATRESEICALSPLASALIVPRPQWFANGDLVRVERHQEQRRPAALPVKHHLASSWCLLSRRYLVQLSAAPLHCCELPVSCPCLHTHTATNATTTATTTARLENWRKSLNVLVDRLCHHQTECSPSRSLACHCPASSQCLQTIKNNG